MAPAIAVINSYKEYRLSAERLVMAGQRVETVVANITQGRRAPLILEFRMESGQT